jgi:hypothetical protein
MAHPSACCHHGSVSGGRCPAGKGVVADSIATSIALSFRRLWRSFRIARNSEMMLFRGKGKMDAATFSESSRVWAFQEVVHRSCEAFASAFQLAILEGVPRSLPDRQIVARARLLHKR